MTPPTSLPPPYPAPYPHVCDVRDPTGARTGTCHLAGSHGGPCPTCHQHADDCAHVPPVDLVRSCPEVACAVHGGWVVEPGTALDLTPPDPTLTPPPAPPPAGRPLLEFVGMRTYGPDHPDRDVLEVRFRLDRSLDVAAVLGRLVEAVRDLDLELRRDPP